MSGLMILVADDNDDARTIVRLALEHRGFRVTTAADGRDAIEQAREHAPDLILMDLQMPVVTGFEAAKTLKADPGTAHIPILALTAIDRQTDLAKHGFCGILLKPILPSELAKAVQRCHEQARAGSDWIEFVDAEQTDGIPGVQP